ncbi:MAG: hypothetical protein KAS73_04005 [Candidatus Sabulitectum sp.]|nr:hypothetical protein [Candidatus Sabulitectum sp.]
MRSLFLITAAILLLACGAEDETPVTEIAQEELPATLSANENTETTTEVVAETIVEEVLDDAAFYTIQNENAGLFHIGITQEKVEELALQYGNVTVEEIDLFTEGMPAPALELTFNTGETVILEISERDQTVYRIEIYSGLFKTEEGIGTGSSYDDLENNYSFDGVVWGDGGDPLVIVEESGLSFMLEPGDWWQMGDVEGEIPGDTEITAVILW